MGKTSVKKNVSSSTPFLMEKRERGNSFCFTKMHTGCLLRPVLHLSGTQKERSLVPLKIVAKTLPANLRLFDIVGRWGGDEFVAVIVNVRKKHLNDIAHRFLSLIKSSNIHLENEILKVTVSIGATIVKVDDTISSIVKRADSLIYKSKVSGGDHVSTERGQKAYSSHHSRAF